MNKRIEISDIEKGYIAQKIIIDNSELSDSELFSLIFQKIGEKITLIELEDYIFDYLRTLKPRQKEKICFGLSKKNVLPTFIIARKITLSYLDKKSFIKLNKITEEDYSFFLEYSRAYEYYFFSNKLLLTNVEKGSLAVKILFNNNIDSKNTFDKLLANYIQKPLTLKYLEDCVFEYLESLEHIERELLYDFLANQNFLPTFINARLIVSSNWSKNQFLRLQKINSLEYDKALELSETFKYYIDLKNKVTELNIEEDRPKLVGKRSLCGRNLQNFGLLENC